MQHHYRQLFQEMEKDVVLSETDEQEIEQHFFLKEFKKNTMLIRAGEVAKHVYFVLQGTLHQYYIDEAGNEKSCAFAFENDFSTDLESFSNKSLSSSYLTVMKPSKCLLISCSHLQALIKKAPAVNDFFRILLERIAAASFKRTKSLLSLTPEQRFAELMKDSPQILQQLSQKLIAQYIGMAPESLSRMKKRIYLHAKS